MSNRGRVGGPARTIETDSVRAKALAAVATGATLLLLDLLWLGVIAAGLYEGWLGPLKRPTVFWPAAGMFYALYIGATVAWAVLGAERPSAAARRGALLGLVAYGTYELTNWAILRGWPALMVPIDICWGVVLTSAASLVGKLVHDQARGGAGA